MSLVIWTAAAGPWLLVFIMVFVWSFKTQSENMATVMYSVLTLGIAVMWPFGVWRGGVTTGFLYWAGVALPWVVGIVYTLFALLSDKAKETVSSMIHAVPVPLTDTLQMESQEDRTKARGYCGFAVVSGVTMVLVASLSPDENPNRSTVDSVTNAFSSAAVISGDALVETLGYLFFFTMLPLLLFWFKILAERRSTANESADGGPVEVDINKARKWLHQGRLIAFILKILIIVYLLFNTMQRIGIPVDGLIQIGTVFSIGLSWSMRDWLSSLWAGFMLAFSTGLTANCVIESKQGEVYIVASTGLMFFICEKYDSVDGAIAARAEFAKNGTTKSTRKYHRLVHLPNSSFVQSGFTLIAYESAMAT